MKTTFTKVAVATVLAGTTLFGGAASAATKDETKITDRYTALKVGMTIEQAAKVIYGKEYKKQLTKKGSSTVLKKKAELTTSSQGQKTTVYAFSDEKNFTNMSVFQFMTKKNSSVYRLTGKSLDLYRADSYTGARESKMKLMKGKKIKTGMTEKQLDAVLSGSGLGEWTGVDAIDWTSIQSKQELDYGLGIKSLSKTYVFPTSTKQRKLVILNYDYEKKTYKVSSQTSL
ncbi:hypothetical protein ACRPK8_03080 [Exiguobacterium sp. TDN 0502]|uniref:hypothetical protein n=1 Tax=Exiguobacterium sp. TDN 0502 TaxID=3420731 RepID=UPI003D771E77